MHPEIAEPAGNRITQARDSIGRTVTYKGEDEQTYTGKVDRVTTTDGKLALTVGGIDGVDPSSVTEVL